MQPLHDIVPRRQQIGERNGAEIVSERRPCRLSNDFALHMTEVTLAIQNAGEAGAQDMTTRCAPMEPMPWAQ